MSPTLTPGTKTRPTPNKSRQIAPRTWIDINAEIKSLNIMHNRNMLRCIIHHTRIHNSSTYSGSKHIHSSIQHVHHNSWNHRYNCRDETNRSTYLLMKNSPATSYVATTFHPTIGHRAHQSLRNTAISKMGMIPQAIRVKTGLHIAKVHKSTKPT